MPANEQSIVLVVGSINADLVAGVERLPVRGETILATDFQQHLGGKGANQAVASALLGADVAMVGCVGDDAAGAQAVEGLKQAGVDPARVRTVVNAPTGTALITVGRSGENTIVVVPGANDKLSIADVQELRANLGTYAAVVLQLEIPDDVVAALVQEISTMRDRVAPSADPVAATSRAGVTSAKPWIVFNPSPYRSSGLLPAGTVDVLLVNEVEAEAMTGLAVENPMDAARAARHLAADLRPGGCVVVTLGDQGAVALTHADEADDEHSVMPLHVPALTVDAVDTTGAGDVFTGGFVARLAAGHSLEDAMRFATAAAALTVTRPGAQSSFPLREEVEELLARVEPVRPLDV